MPISTIGTNAIAAGAVIPADLSQPFTSGTAQASTSGTSINFTSIPSWVKRITVMLNGVSGTGTIVPLIQLGTVSGIDNTSYTGAGGYIQNGGSSGVANYTNGFGITSASGSSSVYHGAVVLTSFGSSNTWVASGVIARSDSTVIGYVAGTKALSGTLDRIRITCATDTFDAGSINILYE